MAKNLNEKRTGSTAWVEDKYIRVGESIGDVQLLAQHAINAFNHVLHDFRRREPDTEAFAENRIILRQKRLVEILHRMVFLEIGKECGTIHAVEGGLGPVEHFFQPEGLKL